MKRNNQFQTQTRPQVLWTAPKPSEDLRKLLEPFPDERTIEGHSTGFEAHVYVRGDERVIIDG